MNKQYFRLLPQCFLVTGAKGAVVLNLYTKEAIWLNQDKSAAIIAAESNQPVSPDDEAIQTFAKLKWGFFANQPYFIDKIRPNNIFIEQRLWKETPNIDLAVLQLNTACPLGCLDCGRQFCPICTTSGNPDDEQNQLSLSEWLTVLDELKYYGTKRILFTGGDPLLFKDLAKLVRRTYQLGILAQLQTTGLIPPPDTLPITGLSVLVKSAEQAAALLKHYGSYPEATLLAAGVAPESLRAKVPSTWKVMNSKAAVPVITKAKLNRPEFDEFFTRRTSDHCLKGKIFITAAGSVLPCFGHQGDPLGNLRRDKFWKPFKVLVEEYWKTPIDKVNPTRKCNRCEYRYICNACRYLNVESQCCYNVDKCTWKQEITTPDPVQK